MFQVSVEGILASLNSAHTHAYPQSIEAVFPKVLALGMRESTVVSFRDISNLYNHEFNNICLRSAAERSHKKSRSRKPTWNLKNRMCAVRASHATLAGED